MSPVSSWLDISITLSTSESPERFVLDFFHLWTQACFKGHGEHGFSLVMHPLNGLAKPLKTQSNTAPLVMKSLSIENRKAF